VSFLSAYRSANLMMAASPMTRRRRQTMYMF
jgi:hypothetical protein